MSEFDDWDVDPYEAAEERPQDPALERAREQLTQFFEAHRNGVFFSRQLEVQFEKEYFHWITNRALRNMVEVGVLRTERHKLQLEAEGAINLLWHRRCRYYRRASKRLMELVKQYSAPAIGAALGLQGEALILEGFASQQFVMSGREAKSYTGKSWDKTGHDLDFVVERDGVGYGIEVKNTLGYMDYPEFRAKVEMCLYLGLRPVMACRMLPRTWAHEVIQAGGYAFIFGYQLYPWGYRDLARRVREELGLPVDSPRRLREGTMARFMGWHRRHV